MRVCMAVVVAVLLTAGVRGAQTDVAGSIAVIRAVGRDGADSQNAAAAWRQLARANVRDLPDVLAGMDGASTVARNWLRAAVDGILERGSGQKLPTAGLEAFLRDTRHDARARRLAFELLRDRDPTVPDRFLNGLLDDPSPELRRDAVAHLLERADRTFAGDRTAALPLYRQALASARDKDQVDRIARRLRELGRPVDLRTHYGLLVHWKLIGPFPNPEGKGVDTVYPPERAVDLKAVYDGRAGKVRWVDFTSKSENGVVDLNLGLGKHDGAVDYAFTEFKSPKARPVEIRLGCYTAFKLWLNDELVLVRGDAYTGMSFDHYVARVRLKPGTNRILLKLGEVDPPPPLPRDWRFLLRVCDAGGAAVLSADRRP